MVTSLADAGGSCGSDCEWKSRGTSGVRDALVVMTWYGIRYGKGRKGSWNALEAAVDARE